MESVIKQLVKIGHGMGAEVAKDEPAVAKLLVELSSALDVQYERGNALEAKCAALAAENAGLNEKMNKLATWPGIEFYSSAWEFNGGDGNTALEFICDVQTPATDSFLAEVRASAIPADVMAAIQKVARIRLDLNDFDGDKRGIVDCLGEAEESLIEIVNKFAAQLRQEAAQ